MNNTPFPGQDDFFPPRETEDTPEELGIPEEFSPEMQDALPEPSEPLPAEEDTSREQEDFRDIAHSIEHVIAEETAAFGASEEEVPSENEAPAEDSLDVFDFGDILEPKSQEPQAPASNRDPVKSRPRRKRGEGLLGIPNILTSLVWAAIILAVGVTLGRMLWICATDVLAFGREDRQVTVTIYDYDTIDDITQKLYDAELIRYPGLFKFYASFAVDEGEIKPGIWDLNTLYDYHALVKMMAPSSQKEVVKVMIPEGYTCRQIFELMEEKRVCTAQSLSSYAQSGELEEYWFLEDVERGDPYCLEGFLFPDTYEFYKNESPEKVLDKMLQNFDTRFTEELRNEIPTLNEHISNMMRADGRDKDYIESHQLSLREIITVASMIEKETASSTESYDIASVIYNRLFSWGNNPPYLNIDATIVYALGGKTDLTAADLQTENPYNTYLNTGLTPGPISNPGLNSIRAALEPNETPSYYYVLDPAANTHHFSRTLEEHNAFRASLGG